ncbi:hypothetical protein DSY14_24765 [Nocardiopsis sp. MG754419]|nr:hypothetical protein [Nocardiopsis sp. MG754419]
MLFRQWTDRPVRWTAAAAASVFTVYVIHVPVVVALQYAAGALTLTPLAAFGLVAVAAVVGSLVPARLMGRTPVLRRLW